MFGYENSLLYRVAVKAGTKANEFAGYTANQGLYSTTVIATRVARACATVVLHCIEQDAKRVASGNGNAGA